MHRSSFGEHKNQYGRHQSLTLKAKYPRHVEQVYKKKQQNKHVVLPLNSENKRAINKLKGNMQVDYK